MSLIDEMMDSNIERLKKMQGKMLDAQEEIYNERGEQIERVNKKSAELSASGTKIHYQAAASGIKEGLKNQPIKYCTECGQTISKTAKFCSECGAKQDR